ncbi:MAG: DUF2974 domain-containing protein [Erysipelotrichia bacterium]|nr:DUF2974 domain-containing protein [Erysipelotrichia bacterium]
MIDYLKWRGDLSFDIDKFNYVDNLLCSYIAYTDLRSIVNFDNKPVTLKQAAEQFFLKHDEKQVRNNRSFISMSPLVLREMAQTKRFQDAKLSYYINDIDKQTTIQFSALRIDLTNNLSYISYCGTDDTLIGWKEDFQLSYKETNAQNKAVKFLQNVTPAFRRYYVGGHSKGGNLAIYAATNCNKATKKRIIQVFNNDGPGLSEELYDAEKFEEIKERIIRIVPQFSIFGQLFAQDCQQYIVKSAQNSIMQHDATSWQVLGNDFVYCDKLDDTSLQIKKGFDHFFQNVNFQQREIFTDELFKAFDDAGIKNVSDLYNEGLPALIKVVKEIAGINDQAREVLYDMIKILIDAYNAKIGKTGRETTQKLKGMLNDAYEEIDKMVEKTKNMHQKKEVRNK